MTLYHHGRPVRFVRRRRRLAVLSLLVLVLAVAVVSTTVRGSWGRTTGSPDAAELPLPGVVGALPGTTPSDDDTTPATGLDPELLVRFTAAQEAAAADGVELVLTSGWRSGEEQQRLVDEALARYDGDVQEAHRWVLPPEASAHVAGRAIDVGPTEGALWLGEHGPAFGLCRVYDNELWHFEPLVDPGGRCPATLPDSSSGWR